jgi:signal transduction histidine kinase
VRIRTHLLLLSAFVIVPSFLAAGAALDKVRESRRQAALRGLQETVRATALLVDGEVQRSLGALAALATSPNIAQERLREFDAQARSIDQPPDVWTLLLDDTGLQRINTSAPFGSPPPPPMARARVAQVLATQRPLITDLFKGPATGRLLTTFYVPVPASSPTGRRYVVAQAFSVQHWAAAFEPSPETTWTSAVIDRTGRFISRSRRAQELLGQPARPELVAAAAAAPEGLIRHETWDGVDAYDAFTHSRLTGWTIAVAAPVASIEESATQAVSWLAAGLVLALSSALGGAALISRRLMRALDSAAASARALGRGEQIVAADTPVREISALNLAFADAAATLSEERNSRGLVESARERLLADAIEARMRAQTENAAKDQFLALLGHELRNPLAAIGAATEVLARGAGLQPVQVRVLEVIRRQNRHLSHIVDDLLEVSRMLSGKIVLEAATMNLAVAVGACIDAMRLTPAAQAHAVELDAADAWIVGDGVRIEQIVSNLVGNALKFSPPGAPVQVRVRAVGADATIEVIDHGPGVAPALRERVFEPFVQGPGRPHQQAAGLGVGLALVRQLVELHGGRVGFAEPQGHAGARLVVTLPRAAGVGGVTSAPRSTPPPGAPTPS